MKNFLFIIVGLLFAVSCAEKVKDISAGEWETEVISAWLTTNNYPTENALSNGGGYILLHHSPSTSGTTPMVGNYVRYDVTGRLLDGSIFKTTRRSEAELLMYKTTTFYGKHFVPVYDSLGSTNILAGVTEMLQYMKEGDSVVLLVPSHKAYGSSTYSESGYSAGVAANTPVIFEIVLREVVAEPRRTYELQQVQQFVDSMNRIYSATYSTDTLNYQCIRDTNNECLHNGLWVRYVDTLPITDSTPLPAKDTVLQLKYAGYYLDGFWLDTNIDTVARKRLKGTFKLQSSYLTTYNHTLEVTSSIPAFDVALRRLNRGSTIEFVFTSNYGYGVAGSSSVPPYTPLRFWVYRVK